jgi:hypothetical protein
VPGDHSPEKVDSVYDQEPFVDVERASHVEKDQRAVVKNPQRKNR